MNHGSGDWTDPVPTQRPTGRPDRAIDESLERSRAAGIDPARVRPDRIPDEELAFRREVNRDLITTARPYFASASELLADLPHAVCATDHDGIIVDGLGNAIESLAAGVRAGYDWSELRVGTNGAGTALAAGVPVMAEGRRHFAHCFHGIVSAGAPVRDPAGRVVGAVAMVTPVTPATPERLALVARIAHSIELGLRIRELVATARREACDRQRIEHVIRRSGSRFRRVVNALDDPVVLCSFVPGEAGRSAWLRVDYVNAAARASTEMADEALVGGRLDAALPVPLETILSDPERVREAGESFTLEVLVDRPDESGEWRTRPLAIRALPLEDGFAVTWREVKERETAEEQARQLEREQATRADAESARRRMADMLERISDGLFALDRDWRFTYLNRRGEVLAGRSREELIGRIVWEELPWLEGSVVARACRRAVEEQTPIRLELPSRAGDRWYEVNAYPSDEGLSVYHRDVTAEKRARDGKHFLIEVGELLASSLDYGTILKHVARLAVPAFADWCLIEAFGEDDRDRAVEITANEPRKESVLREVLRRSRDGDRDDHPVFRLLRAGGTTLLQEPGDIAEALGALELDDVDRVLLESLECRSWMIVPIVARGQPLGGMAMAVAESDRRYGAEDLALAKQFAHRAALALENARLYREAQRAIGMRDEVLRFVSHDLRNPLNVIGLAASQLLNTAPPAGFGEAVERRLGMVQRSATQMSRLIDDLLDVTRMEAGHLPVEPRPHAVGALVAEAVESAGPFAAHKAIRLGTAIPDPSLRILVDRGRILQVFANLIGNAVKFTPESGRITIAAESSGAMVRFSVSDTGPGIPADALPRIFDRFWQAHHTHRAGAGLGLAIVKNIVEAHGGRVWVESEVAAGSTFIFTLPAAKDATG